MLHSVPTVCVVVMTCERPNLLVRLLRDLRRQEESIKLRVRVYDDASLSDYGPVRSVLKEDGHVYVRAGTSHGLRDHWRWFSLALSQLRSEDAEYFLFIQDDMRPCTDFLRKLLQVWDSIEDPRKIALNPLVDAGRVAVSCWTGISPRRVGDVELTGWVDGVFLCTRRLLEQLEFCIEPVPVSRWRCKPELSSGVGADISRRLCNQGFNIYRTLQSLVAHVSHDSLMHPGRRVETVRFADGSDALRRLENEAMED